MKFLFSVSVLVLTFTAFSGAYAQEGEMAPVGGQASVMKIEAPVVEEAKEDEVKAPKLGENKPVDNLEPVSGTVPLLGTPFYDFYERQIRYKKADKEYRSSIEARRVVFEQPNSEHSNAAKTKIEEIYKKENEEALKAQQKAAAQAESKVANVPPMPPQPNVPMQPKDNRPIVPVGDPGDGAPKAMNDKVDDSAKQQASVTPPSAPPAVSPKSVPDVKLKTAVQAPVPPATTPVEEEKKVGVKKIDIEETPQEGMPSKKVVVPENAPDFEKSPF